MTRFPHFVALTSLVLALAACDSEPATPTDDDAAATQASRQPASPPPADAGKSAVLTERSDIEEAHRCRGLTAAAWAAAKTLPPGDIPGEVAGLDMRVVNYWLHRAGNVAPDAITDAEEAKLIAGSTRAIATREALVREGSIIRACIDAAAV